MRSALSSLPAKLAAAATGLVLVTPGLAVANALPSPMQLAAAGIGDVIGVDVPTPDDSTPLPTDGTTPLPTDGTTPLPSDGTTPLPTDGTAPLPTDGTAPLPTDGTAPLPGDTTVLPPPATSASEAARIHAFDEACGNHGQYVSYVARFGSEPTCATDARAGTTTTPPVPTGDPGDTAGSSSTADTRKGGGEARSAGRKGTRPTQAEPRTGGGKPAAGTKSSGGKARA